MLERLKNNEILKNIQSKQFLLPFLGVAVFLVISLAYFYPDVFEGNVLRQHDTVQGISNGHEAQVFEDETGETTRWTNSLFSGMPTASGCRTRQTSFSL